MSPVTFHTGLGLLFSLLGLIGVAVLFWFGLRRPPVRQPSCGSCGYAVEGLEALSCPECGSDLRKVGIETPKRQMLHPGLFILFLSLLLIVPFSTAFSFAMRAAPRTFTTHATFGLASTSDSMPQLHIDMRSEASGTGRSVFVSSGSESTSMRDGVMTSTFQFPTIAGATTRYFTVDVRTAVDAVNAVAPNVTLDGSEGETGTVDQATLKLVFDDKDFSLEDGAEVAGLLNAMMNGDADFTTTRLRIAGKNTVTSMSRTQAWYAPTLVAAGAVLYALGILVYLVLRKRRLAT